MKLVARILDKEGNLLGWQEMLGKVPGDGTIRVPRTMIPIDRDGTANRMSIHWCDMNVEYSSNLKPMPVLFGQLFTAEPCSIVVGKVASGLPPVTTRSNVTVAVPTGSLAAHGN